MDAYHDAEQRFHLHLISECETIRAALADLLEPHYDLRFMRPVDILQQHRDGHEAVVARGAAVLIDWCEGTIAVILALKGAARRVAVPLVALCGPERAEQAAALGVGADAVLVRPLSPILLQASLQAYHRLAGGRASPQAGSAGDGVPGGVPSVAVPPYPEGHEVYSVGPLVLDRTARRFYVHGRLEELPSRAFDLMAFLMRGVGICHPRDEILQEVWGIDFDTETNILDVQIYTLRRKLRARGVRGVIQTVRGVGYRLA